MYKMLVVDIDVPSTNSAIIFIVVVFKMRSHTTTNKTKTIKKVSTWAYIQTMWLT